MRGRWSTKRYAGEQGDKGPWTNFDRARNKWVQRAEWDGAAFVCGTSANPSEMVGEGVRGLQCNISAHTNGGYIMVLGATFGVIVVT